jgi:peptide/nickel transport system ATP-binding protein
LNKDVLLEVRDLRVAFNTASGMVKALNGVSFDIMENESVGIVGESGCGKSVTARAIMRILEKNSVMKGSIRLNTGGEVTDISALPNESEEMRKVRGGLIAMIFQEPMSSLCPVYTVGNQINEAIRLHRDVDKKQATEIAIDYLRKVGISRPDKLINEYPYQLSGGMRQRVVIAMAISCNPSLLIADEPTTALDVTVSAQILALLRDLQQSQDMAIMMINHSLGIVAQSCTRVMVMYLGMIIESASVEELFSNPKHPYTVDLLNSIPKLNLSKDSRLAHIKGHVPDPFNIPKGCTYHTRCRFSKKGLCDQQIPDVYQVGDQHFAQCYKYSEHAGLWE